LPKTCGKHFIVNGWEGYTAANLDWQEEIELQKRDELQSVIGEVSFSIEKWLGGHRVGGEFLLLE